MTKTRTMILPLVLVAAAACTSRVQADDCNYLFGTQFGYGFSGTLYGMGHVPVPPYFAIHPPVYYGDRYARPYGASPFANRVPLATPEGYVPVPDGLNMEDYRPHHHMPQGDANSVQHRIARRPLMIENPYYKSNEAESDDTPIAKGEVIVNPYVSLVGN